MTHPFRNSRLCVLSASIALLLPSAGLVAATVTYSPGNNLTDPLSTTSSDPLTLTLDSGLATQSGIISGDGSVSKTGNGTLTLTASNSYSGQTLVNEGVLAIDSYGNTTFGTLGSGLTTINGSADALGAPGVLQFLTSASAGSGTFTLNSNTIGGGVEFHDQSTAGSSTLTANGGTASGTYGGFVSFFNESTAGSATLIANGGTGGGEGGTIVFFDDSTGGTSAVKLFGNAGLDISLHTLGSVAIGSLEGAGTVFLGSNNLTVGTNNTNTTFAGSVQDGGYSGGVSGSLSKTGTGTLTLAGANSYTGDTVIANGSLIVSGSLGAGNYAGALANDGALKFASPATQVLTGVISGNGSLTLSGNGTLILAGENTYSGGTTISGGTLQIGNGGATGGIVGDITNNAALTFKRSDAISFDGVISGSGSVTQAGSGVLTLSAINTYTGATNVTAGTLALTGDERISASSTLFISGNATLELAGHTQTVAGLGSAGNGLIGNITPGTIATAGDTFLTSGTFANTWTDSGKLYLGGNTTTTIALNGINDSVAADGNQVIIGGNITGEAGNVRLDNPLALAAATETVQLWGGILNLNGQANVRAGSIVLESGASTALINGATSTTASFAGGVSLVTGLAQIGGRGDINLSGVLSGSGGFTKTSSGTVTLSNDNTYTGNTGILAGSLVISGTLGSGDYHGTIANSGALTFAAPTADQTLAGVISGNGSFTKSGGGILTLSAANTFSGNITLSGGTLLVTGNLASGNYSGTIANSGALAFDSASNQSLTGVISGAGSFTKSGNGTLTLGATNTYSGGTVLNGGILGLAADGALGSGPITINGGNLRAVNAGRNLSNAITLAGDFTLGRLTDLSGPITLTNDVTLIRSNPDAGDGQSTLSGVISGAHSLTFAQGANPYTTIVLTGENTYTGGTVIAAGNLRIGDGDTHGSILGNIVNNGSVTFNRADDITISSNISGSGALTQAGIGMLTLTGTNTYAGGTTINGSAVISFTSGSLGSGKITLDGGGLQWAAGNTADISSQLNPLGTNGAHFDTNGNDVTFASPVRGTFGQYSPVLKSGGGTLALAGAPDILEFDVAGGTLDFGPGAYEGYLSVGDGLLPSAAATPTAAKISGNGTSFITYQMVIGGNHGSGSITISAGATVAAPGNDTIVGLGSLGESNLTVTGAGSTLTAVNGVIIVGYSNSGLASLVVADNAAVTAAYTVIGFQSPGSNAVTVAGAGSTLTITNTLYVGYSGSTDASSSMTISGGATASAVTTVIGNIGGTGENSLTISGAGSKFTNTGTLTLGSQPNVHGTLNIGSAATDAATAAGILDTATVTAGAGIARLQFNTTGTGLAPAYFTRDGTSTGTGVKITGNVSLVNTAGTTVLTGNATHTGGTMINGGALQIGNGGTTGALAGNVALANGGTLAFNHSDAITFGGAISGNGSLNQLGSGTLTISTANTFTGGSLIQAGVLQLQNNLGLGSGQVHVGGGTLLIDSNVTAFTNNVLLEGGSISRVLNPNADLTNSVNATSHFAGGRPDTTANILQGTLSSGGQLDTSFQPTSLALNDGMRRSDVFSLHGTANDVIVLELSVTGVTKDSYLGWRDPVLDIWVNAVLGNTGASIAFFAGDKAYNAATDYHLGYYGVDTTTGAVWAVVNHNSEFAVVPEPSTCLLAGLGIVGLCGMRRRPKAGSAASR